jgi:hypothetical protein
MIKKDGDRIIITTSISKGTKQQLIAIAKKEHRSLARQLDFMIERYARIYLDK